MSNDILVGIIGFILCLWFTIYTIELFKKIFRKYEFLKDENNKILKWKNIKAKVLSKSINTDYTYDDCSYNEMLEFIDISEDEFFQLKEAAYENSLLNGNIEINYGYIVNKEKLYSRAIGLLPIDSDIDLFYKINKGDVIDIFINPEDKNDSFIRKTSTDELDKLEWNECKNEIPSLLFALFLWIIWGFGIYQFM